MVSVWRATAIWTGFAGAPGYSKFSFDGLTSQAALDAAGSELRTFFAAIASHLHTTWTITVQQEIQEVDMSTGVLLGVHMITAPVSPVPGTSLAAAYAGGSGACVTWNTGLIFNGHRVKGRTFLVPLAGSSYDPDGTLTTAVIADVSAAGNALATATQATLAVWSKKFDTSTPPQQISGALAPVDSASVKDMASQLRSRRL